MNSAENSMTEIETYMVKLGVQARQAAHSVNKATTAQKNDALLAIAQEIDSKEINTHIDSVGISIVDLLTAHSDICQSNGDARRAIKNNAISVNKVKINSHEAKITASDLIHNSYMMVENGKKNKYILKFK